MRISDWSSDVCSSDLHPKAGGIEEAEPDRVDAFPRRFKMHGGLDNARQMIRVDRDDQAWTGKAASQFRAHAARLCLPAVDRSKAVVAEQRRPPRAGIWPLMLRVMGGRIAGRSEEHTSELQSLMRISYAA